MGLPAQCWGTVVRGSRETLICKEQGDCHLRGVQSSILHHCQIYQAMLTRQYGSRCVFWQDFHCNIIHCSLKGWVRWKAWLTFLLFGYTVTLSLIIFPPLLARSLHMNQLDHTMPIREEPSAQHNHWAQPAGQSKPKSPPCSPSHLSPTKNPSNTPEPTTKTRNHVCLQGTMFAAGRI